MNSNREEALRALQKARKFLDVGNKRTARDWIERALSAAPELEESWLLLAEVASPHARMAYLQEALRINPGSERALGEIRKAQENQSRSGHVNEKRHKVGTGGTSSWRRAASPVLHAESAGENAPTEGSGTASTMGEKFPAIKKKDPGRKNALGGGQPGVLESYGSAITVRRHGCMPILILITFLSFVWMYWPSIAAPVLGYLGNSVGFAQDPTFPAAAAVEVAKPTYTPSPTSTPTSTPTFTPTVTPTNTPTSTPTRTPVPPPISTSTPASSAPETYRNPLQTTTDDRWIDVDLSLQRLYAYEGNTVIATFVVSTGIWQYPTVTGQFHIYTRLRYADMAGPGYYLPNVPYTMYFYKGYGLHGTYWHNNFGTPMSHGCINLSIPDAGWLFDFTSVGTLVNIHY